MINKKTHILNVLIIVKKNKIYLHTNPDFDHLLKILVNTNGLTNFEKFYHEYYLSEYLNYQRIEDKMMYV